MQSGSAYSPWAFSSNPLKFAYQLVEKVDCAQHSHPATTGNQTGDALQPNTNSQIMQCLRSKSVDQILAAQRQIQAPLHLSAFGPTIDGLLVTNNNFDQNFNNFNNFLNQQQTASPAANGNPHHSSPAHPHAVPNHAAGASPGPVHHNLMLNNISNTPTIFQSFASFTSSSASSIPLLVGLSRLDVRWTDYEAIFNAEDRRNPFLLREKALKGLVKSLYAFHQNVSHLRLFSKFSKLLVNNHGSSYARSVCLSTDRVLSYVFSS